MPAFKLGGVLFRTDSASSNRDTERDMDTPLIPVAFGIVLTALLLAKAGAWSRRQAADMGSVSSHWVTAHHAAEPAH